MTKSEKNSKNNVPSKQYILQKIRNNLKKFSFLIFTAPRLSSADLFKSKDLIFNY